MSSTLSRFKQMSPQARELLHALRFPPEATEQVYALVDCNNFYASCERAFDPKLKDVPIVVLSSNDGCIVARSNEVRAMGVGMGEPYFKYKEIIEGNNVKVFSSNFTFYGDMSRRVMSTLMQFAPEMEIYSIDEAFLNLAGCDHLRGKPDLTEYAREIAATVRKWTGIPVSVGLAPTKTLGKLANYLAKKKPESGGVMNLLDRSIRDAALESAPVGAIWGVGPKSTEYFERIGVKTARALRDLDDEMVLRKMGAAGLRPLYELRGFSCSDLDTRLQPSRKRITSSGSFGRRLKSLSEIKGAVAGHVAIAARKLRRQKSATQILTVYLLTRSFGQKPTDKSRSFKVRLRRPTNNSSEIIPYALKAVETIYEPGSEFRKAGIFVDNFIPEDQVQSLLFRTEQPGHSRELMQTIDKINRRLGRGTIKYAAQLPAQWTGARCEHASPRYTTNWDELVEVS